MGFSDGRKTSGLYAAEVARSERITPHMVRVTFTGKDLERLPRRGFDQWFRLFLPHSGGRTDFAAVPDRLGVASYVKYLTSKSSTRPPFRNYTARELRPETAELDVDFVVHGDQGIAGPWAQQARSGEQVMLLDQGRGFDPLGDATEFLLVGDESALPAIAGILRDLPRDTTGLAIIEIPETADRQILDAPAGFEISWLPRDHPGNHPGRLAIEAATTYRPTDPGGLQAYLAGEQSLVAQTRRSLVGAGIPKTRITFTGYWRSGRSS
ncbi:siderophore-interacting protein [Microlunatus endophyticus]|uniref:Siderophore-interacting protein n=1 Tax=Microlunatus endophyticus TaxID=1716077 RepID=A0A917W2B0_9ACTN|nr:siderophore-interacting protein [Microlunatus endophyticus]GGL59848.1 siderophore-interacting protein [Microlunatus endophyticus]